MQGQDHKESALCYAYALGRWNIIDRNQFRRRSPIARNDDFPLPPLSDGLDKSEQ